MVPKWSQTGPEMVQNGPEWPKNGPILDLGWFEWVERYFVCLSLIRNLALPEVISFFFVSINIYPEMSLS